MELVWLLGGIILGFFAGIITVKGRLDWQRNFINAINVANVKN